MIKTAQSNWGVYQFLTSNSEIPHLNKINLVTNHNVWEDEVSGLERKYEYSGEICGKMQHLFIGSKYTVEARIVYSDRYGKYQFEPITVWLMYPKH